MKRIVLISISFLFVLGTAWAQRTVSGIVTSDDGSGGIPGVNVILKGTATGTTTDLDGNYRLSVPEEGGTLEFSFIGLSSQEVVIGARAVIDITMMEDVETLSEVVVTGLGVVKEKKALGYGVSSISSDALVARQESDVARLLRGKATGVDIASTSGLAGSGTNIIIRGYSSITGSNQPLFVVDGIPFNTETNTGGQGFGSGSATASSRFLDLDPNSIAEISILKGLSATVLYGEQGRNGVVLVTTKNGKAGAGASKKMEVSVTQGIFQSEVANVPDYQNTYGNGFNAGFDWYFSNWGAAFDDTNPGSYGSNFKGLTPDGKGVYITHPYDQDQYRNDFDGVYDDVQDYLYKPFNNVEDFFQKGLSSNTSVSIQKSLSANSSVSATYSYLTEEGFTPQLDDIVMSPGRTERRTNYIDKHNFGIGYRTELENGLSLKSSFNYVNTDRRTPITAPAFGGDGNGLFAAIMFTPRSMDLMGLPFQSPIDNRNVYYRRGGPIQNPRWTLNNSGQDEAVSRFFSNTELAYKLGENWNVMYRLSIDTYNQTNNRFVNIGGPRQPLGEFSTFSVDRWTNSQVLNLMYDYKIGSSFTLDGIVGFNSVSQKGAFVGTTSQEQFVYNLLNHGNFIEHNNFSGFQNENVLGLYATASLGYNGWAYLTAQARNDWTSTLEEANRSVLYPSVSASFVISDAVEGIGNSKAVDYIKVRVGYGTSAGYPEPYQTRNILNSSTNDFVTPGGSILNTNSVSNQLGNGNLQRELFTEVEAGLEARLFQDLIGIDLSLYNKESSDLIVALPLDPSTGYTNTTVNAAKVTNKGVELGVNIRPPIPGAVRWDINLNYTRNIPTVNSIYEGIERVQIEGYGGSLGNYAIPGEPFGAMYGSTFMRTDNDDPNSQYVVESIGNYQSSGEFSIIGNPNPDYTANWMNTITWKGLSFGFQWQYIKGGDIYSSTIQALLARGNTTDTDVDRNIPIIMPGAVKQDGVDGAGDPVYVANDIQTYMGDSFFRAYFYANEGGVFDASVLRLREVSLAYVLPKTWLEKSPFGSAALTISGENLWYNAPNFPVGTNFDPEISSTGVGNGRGFDFRTAPTAKKYGMTLNLTF
ncbi:MAG: SusC/RagA family TonB-linked outer membrane protein [Flammeovirgaceae bacterium]|nr:SusC/RagA family TonB-linked outer membrane protein [Flammeovirgaceae bacterium]